MFAVSNIKKRSVKSFSMWTVSEFKHDQLATVYPGIHDIFHFPDMATMFDLYFQMDGYVSIIHLSSVFNQNSIKKIDENAVVVPS